MSRSTLAMLVVVGVAASSCSGSDDELVVFAASSLADVMDEVEDEWETEHPGLDVVVNLAGSSSLVAQIADGAPADVLITADVTTMQRAQQVASIGAPETLALNELVIAVEAGNPEDVSSVADLGRDDLVVVLAAPEVPAGAYAAEVLSCSSVEADAASFEQSVRAVAAKVRFGEADAALVYRTDIDEALDAVEVGSGCEVRAEYRIAAIGGSSEASDFVEAMLGPLGREPLSSEGFVLP